MKRLLCIVSSMDTGGAETFLMKMYRALDKSKYQMDFCVSKTGANFYDDEIKRLGGKVFRITPKSKNPLKSFMDVRKLVKENSYEHVLRIGQSSLATTDLIAARLGGARCLALRSSNSDTCGGFVSNVIHKLLSPLTKIVPNVKIAPSTEAALHVFGKRNVRENKVTFLNNAICVDNFLMNEDIRQKMRNELKIEDKFVVGHVGRFAEQKNHKFLIEIFAQIKKKKSDSVLILIGEGELQNGIKEKVDSLGLSDSVKFLGVRSDVSHVYMAMDAVLFPSFFEGMPNVLIEAQGSGLHCITSDTVTKEANITGLVDYISLEKSAEYWADVVLGYANGYARENYKAQFVRNGYDIESAAKCFSDTIFEYNK